MSNVENLRQALKLAVKLANQNIKNYEEGLIPLATFRHRDQAIYDAHYDLITLDMLAGFYLP